LDFAKPPSDPNGRTEEYWSPLEALVDPALYIKTEEFLQTLRMYLARNKEVKS
jgi:hypothetical protein